MRLKMPQIRGKTILLGLVVLFAFYWIAVKPHYDRQHCYKYALSQIRQDLGGPENDKLFNLYGRNYTLCVNSRGLGE